MGGEEWGGTALFDLAGLVATVIGGTGVPGGVVCRNWRRPNHVVTTRGG